MNLKLIKLQLLLISVLCLILAAEWSYTTFYEPDIQHVSNNHVDENNDSVTLPTLTDANAQALDDNELVERPLFYEGRRQPEPPAEESSETTELSQLDDWQLSGVFTKKKQQMALFSKKDDSKTYLKITVGQSISGCLLQEIQSDRVILQQAGQPKIILLRKPRSEPAVADAPPPTPTTARSRGGRPAPPPRVIRPVMQPPIPNSENANDDNQN